MLKFILFIPLLTLQALAYDWHEESNLFWAERCDWTGNDLSNARISGQECGPRCASTPGCTHFTWTGYNGGTCWMKKNGASRDQAKTPNEYSVCGYMKLVPGPPPPSGGFKYLTGPQNGKTTRYWDCCKPSCSWNNKAQVSSPVKACKKDGVTAAGVNDLNICRDNGPSYICNSNQPWAIDDNLAYGFAAAKINGQGENNWCCACYELTFTSGPVQGKRFVVQAVNTGDDLNENHFDLQMPGGGVGVFPEGCQNQWGAPPGTGWGRQSGGIFSRDQCYQLPGALQPGCFWRFDWFKNADNPSISFRRIVCPAELTQKTGCKRNDDQ